MSYYLDLFSPFTYESFLSSHQDISGFRLRQLKAARKLKPGDKLICYMTKLSRWIAILEVTSKCFQDDTPLFYESDDPFVVRFKVKPLALLPKEKAIPIKEAKIWNNLSFTKDIPQHGSQWTGPLRSSLVKMTDSDGKFLEEIINSQAPLLALYGSYPPSFSSSRYGHIHSLFLYTLSVVIITPILTESVNLIASKTFAVPKVFVSNVSSGFL